MRIQHNIMAMNAYRNYNTNNKALSGNLEKLSSGYKINRAGDDAAGLAISEKMRAQITGLNAAQKNVKDGISLVKTAEGAMQEIQDMLNRMDYLATQSANGTYQDEVDREALQKEVNQLKDEIDRIADSANFNGIKLLDGSKDGSGASLKAAQSAAKAAAENVQKMKAELDKANAMNVAGKDTAKTSTEIETLMGANAASTDSIADAIAGGKTILETDAVDTGSVGFSIDLDGVNYVMSGSSTASISLSIGSATVSITEADIKASVSTATTGTQITGDQLAAVIAKKYSATAAGTTLNASGAGADLYKVTADGTKLNFAAQDNLTTRPNRHYDVKLTTTANTTNIETSAVANKFTSGAVSASAATTVGTEVKMTVAYSYVDETDGSLKNGTVEVKYQVKATGSTTNTRETNAEIAQGLANAINDNATLKKYFAASANTAGNVILEARTGGTVAATAGGGVTNAAKVTGITTPAGIENAVTTASTAAGAQVDGKNAYTAGLGNSYVNKGTENIVMAGEDKKDLLASTVLDLNSVLKDGTKIKLGNETYRIALGENSAYKGDGTNYNGSEKVVYLNDENADVADIASKLSEIAKDNDVFTVSHIGTDGKIGLKQKESAKDDTDMSTRSNLASYIGISTITTAGDQSIKDKAIAEAQANYDAAVAKQTAADAKVTELSKNPGKALQLQIGDTSEEWNQLQVNIGSMKTDALGIADLDIGTAEKAAEAINTIKDAINNVSSVRGDLGAYQNRLDHTANNLSVMAENIQDAESTIRDTDVAEEMMSYVKNNILVQSAQAMLAQANQVPQGVLQLLG